MSNAILYTNDGSKNEPHLRLDLNLGNLDGLPEWSTGPRGSEADIAEAIKAAGFEGVQGEDCAGYAALGLKVTTLGRANTPEEIDAVAKRAVDGGYECATLHVAWGMEDDNEVDRLVGAVLDSSARHGVPLYVETHRATITQDLYRTVKLAERNPDIRFNADFSHWYTGQEMIYGDIDAKFDFIEPVFARVAYMHARVGNSGHIQVPLHDPSMEKAMEHYRELWTRAMAGFLRGAGPGDFLVFAPELLPSPINYARLYKNDAGEWVEDGDRWEDALKLADVAKQCFAEAQRRVGK
mgnify:CR=1 FL=1